MSRLFDRLLSTLNFIAAMLIVTIMMVITIDVVGRAAFGSPLNGVPEITKFSIVCMVWLQMAFALRQRQHMRSTFILNLLPGKGRQAVILLNCIAGAVLMGMIAYFSYPELLRAYRIGSFEGEHPVRIPTWPIWAIVVGGSALTSLEYLLQSFQALAGKEEDFSSSGSLTE